MNSNNGIYAAYKHHANSSSIRSSSSSSSSRHEWCTN